MSGAGFRSVTDHMRWYPVEDPPCSGVKILVAVDHGSYREVFPGRITRGKPRAVGCTIDPYAWACIPSAPPRSYKELP